MNHFLSIQEVALTTDENKLKTKQIKITNTSGQFINNLKLKIDESNLSIVEQTIIRDRGILCYDKSLRILDLGNLAPDESALFEYKYSAENEKNLKSLLDYMHISYIPEDASSEIIEYASQKIKDVAK